MNEFVRNKLKSITVEELESIVNKAISEAVGEEEMETTISSIDYSRAVTTGAKFTVEISRVINFPRPS